jgi:dual specificity protein kinase YAK1
MVQLECYFVHQNHLCLVFELLGLNLYEVLKRRQFRGLPLPIVRSLINKPWKEYEIYVPSLSYIVT